MKWSDLPIHPSPKVLRQFAGAWLVFFLAAGAIQYFSRGRATVGEALGLLGLIIGTAGLIKPGLVRPLFVICMVLAFPIGWVVSQVALLVMFYGLITPMGLIMRLLGRDPLQRRPCPGQSSHWLPKPAAKDIRNYFKQY